MMEKMIETVKGFRDVLPEESLKRRKIREIIEKNFKIFGFVPIETPTIEYEDVAKGENEEDSAVSERFKLRDRGDRALSLRYEFTFQLKRLFKENTNIKLPFRRYEIGSIFRDEPIEKDRYREFIQCDADIIGDSSIKADAECLALADKICKDLNVAYKLKINNRKLLNSIFKRLEIINPESVLRELDKVDKLGEDEVKSNLSKIIDKSQVYQLFKLLNNNIDFFIQEKYEGAEELKELLQLLKAYGIKAIFSPFLARGFAYYTGSIFEGYNEKIKGSIFGGGRFDNLVGSYIKREIPAVGISFGRLLDYPDVEIEGLKALLISIGEEKRAIELLRNMRDAGIACFMMDKPGKAMEYADSNKIPFVVFIGKEEMKKKKVKLRNMKTGVEKLLVESSAIKTILKN